MKICKNHQKKPRSIRKRGLRSLRVQTELEDFITVQDRHDSGEKPRARRECWNRRRRQKGKQNRRFVGPWVENPVIDTVKKSRLKLYEQDNETFPIPLKYVDVMRQTQTSIWKYLRWQMDRSEGCQSFWGMDLDHKFPDPTCKTSWRIHVG